MFRPEWRGQARSLPIPVDDEVDETSGVHARPVKEAVLDGRRVSAPELTPWLYQLDREGMAFREQIKELLAEPEFAPREGLTMKERSELSYSRFRRLRQELDLRLRDVEERPARLAAALELIGVVDGTLFTVMSIHYCLCGGSLLRHGAGSPAIDEYIDELDSLETFGTFLVTELGYGNNVVSLKTRADYDVDRAELIVSTPCPEARKFMPNTGLSGVPKLGVVMARLFVRGEDHGIFPLVMRLRTGRGTCPGVSITPLGEKPTYALDNAMTSFHGVRVPKHCLLLGKHSVLGDDGSFKSTMRGRRDRFLLSMDQVQMGRLCLASLGATASGASSFIALKYSEQRRTFAPRHADVSVLEYRNHQRDLFSALAYAYASRCLVNFAIRKYEHAGDSEHNYCFRITSATKAHVTYSTERLIRLCRERCGAAGMLEENRLSTYAAQCQGLITAEGDNQIVLIKIARQMLLKQGYVRLDKSRHDHAATLSHPERLLGLVRERERRLLDELRRAMVPARLPGADLFEIWNENINLALETATAHSSRLAAEAFWRGAEALASGHPTIDLFRLFALMEIAPHLGFFLAEGLVSTDEVKKHGRLVDHWCRSLRPFATELAEAFDIPNSLLRAPLATDDYIAHYDSRARRLAPPVSGEFTIGDDGSIASSRAAQSAAPLGLI
jgi:acyl-CoA oxidase